MPAGGASAAAEPPAHAPQVSVGGDAQPPQADQSAPAAPPLPPPPIPEAPTEHLPATSAGERPTQAQNHPPGDGHNGPGPDSR
jgi:hypothetical protein